MRAFWTIVIGFIAGLVVSGVLGDLIIVAKNSVVRIYCAWEIVSAEKMVAAGDFSNAISEYENVLKYISPENKKLLAKTKNNLAMSVFSAADKEKNRRSLQKSIEIFDEALALYREINYAEGVKQVEINIQTAKSVLESLEENR
jgi:tetratricopeptide (TPR) repeat protein